MQTARLKWIVKIPAGQWMAGVHRFGTRKAAKSFARRWAATCAMTSVGSVDHKAAPAVRKEERATEVASDSQIIARAARRAAQEGNRRDAERLRRAEEEQRVMSKQEENAVRWHFVATHPQYQGTLNGYPTFTEAVDAARAALAEKGERK